MAPEEIESLAERVRAGERRALARAITLIESTRPDHRRAAEALTDALAGAGREALRVGLTGTPGVGKSCFIEALGLDLVEAGHRVAVLAVDPSSARSGGAILGDKTRMPQLARHPRAFIRPSPSGAELGGVARRSREAIAIVGAAGFDIVLVETVGVGQSETLVAEMTDIFLLLIAPAGGDELQGVKRGVMEIADLIVVNKADGALEAQANATRADYAGALSLMAKRPGDPEGYPVAMTASARTGTGLEAVWEKLGALARWRRETGWRDRRRGEQALSALERVLAEGAVATLKADARVAERLAQLRPEVAAETLPPEKAAEELLALFRGSG